LHLKLSTNLKRTFDVRLSLVHHFIASEIFGKLWQRSEFKEISSIISCNCKKQTLVYAPLA